LGHFEERRVGACRAGRASGIISAALAGDDDRIVDVIGFGSLRQLWELPGGGGRAQVTAGAELRWENYNAWKAPYAGLNPVGSGADFPYLRENDNDFIAMSPNADINASQAVQSAHAEIGLPLVTEANSFPLFHRLELGAAIRHERFSIHGQSTTPKFSVLWAPTSWLRLRGSYNESFRAPNLAQTNTNPLLRVNYTADPYREDMTNSAADSSGPRRTYRQGNDRLNPERAKSWNFGVVVDVPGLARPVLHGRVLEDAPARRHHHLR